VKKLSPRSNRGAAEAAARSDTSGANPDSAPSLRLAACELCGEDVALRYRVQHREDRLWRLVCPDCQARVANDNPHYRYGGTWKARRRRP